MADVSWTSLSAFLAMDGKALYVWGSFGVALMCMLGEALAVAWRTQRARQAVQPASARGQRH